MRFNFNLFLVATILIGPAIAYGKDENCGNNGVIDQSTAKSLIDVSKKLEGARCQLTEKQIKTFKHLCSDIGSQIESKVPDAEKKGAFYYQQRVYDAACVSLDELDERDPGIPGKIRPVWDEHIKKLECEGGAGGNKNILKYAAQQRFNDFMADAIIRWKIDLNYMPPGDDNRTLLDFLEEALAGPLNSGQREDFEYYKKIALKAGAKRSKDLK